MIGVILGVAALLVGAYFVFGLPWCFDDDRDTFSDTSSIEKEAVRAVVATTAAMTTAMTAAAA